MKKLLWTILILVAVSAIAQPMYDPQGARHETPPTKVGDTHNVTPEMLVADGWRYETEAQAAEYAAQLAAQAAASEAARIASKPNDLKVAENDFLAAVFLFNAEHGEHAISLTDGFMQITEKIEATDMSDLDKLKLGMNLRTLWDVVLFHGGRFGDVQYHADAVR